MTERNGSKLEDIHAHAVKTNGRVTKLEKSTIVLITSLVVTVATRPDGIVSILRIVSGWIK